MALPGEKAKAVRVVADLPADLLLDYSVPPELAGSVTVGSEVFIPLGRRKARGFVIKEFASPSRPLRDLSGVSPRAPLFHPNLVELVEWVSRYYFSSFPRAFRCALPALVRRGTGWKRDRTAELLIGREEARDLARKLEKRARARSRVLAFLAGNPGPLDARKLREEAGADGQILAALAAKGLVKLGWAEFEGAGAEEEKVLPSTPLKLTAEQEEVFGRISSGLERDRFEVFLIHGITGSGKTEIYLQLIERTLALGRQAIVLVPEISLTPQIGDRFRSRFGGRVAVIHSRLSGGERNRRWRRIAAGGAGVVLGPRSAVFAPVPRLGLIVVDEEHETSYKQGEQSPFYHARDTAVMRAKLESATAVLGSATPSLESYYNSRRGKYALLNLRRRPEQAVLPAVKVIDMRKERDRTRAGFLFSEYLVEEVRAALAAGRQAILFLNRRGFTTLLICRDCGYTARCRHCSISLTYHRARGLLICHYCGFTARPWASCPLCRSRSVLVAGTGTEKVEDRIARIFPGAKVGRMDTDTAGAKGASERILRELKLGRINILVGTRMIAKGLDYPNITLVGVVLADPALNLPDFRAGEYAFQLLTQVAGRSGRGAAAGKVVIQTLVPSHPAVAAAARQDFEEFYRREIGFREELGYPPFNHFILVTTLSRDQRQCDRAAELIASGIKRRLPPGTEVLGPSVPPVERRRGRWRRQLVIKTKNVAGVLGVLGTVFDSSRRDRSWRVEVDVDPVSMM